MTTHLSEGSKTKQVVFVMHERLSWDLILLSHGWAQHCRWNLTTEGFMKGFCECFMPRQLEASHETPSSLINNSVYAFLILPMNAQTICFIPSYRPTSFTLSASITHIHFADRHTHSDSVSEMSPVRAWLKARQIHRVYHINHAFFSRARSTSRYKVLDLIMKDVLLAFKRNFSLRDKSEGEREKEMIRVFYLFL